MKKFSFLIIFITVFLTSCSNQRYNLETSNNSFQYSVFDWNSIEYNGNTYHSSDKYGNNFKDYNIFYELNKKTVPAIYYSQGEKFDKTELKTYIGDTEINFISQVSHWYDLFEPTVYGNVNNPRFNYLDIYDNVDKISVVYQDSEYILPNTLANEIWSALSEMEQKSFNEYNLNWKKTSLESSIYLYIKDVNAAVYVGILCYNENDELCISNTNYRKLCPLSSQWQDFGVLIESCERVKNSFLNSN